jgi:hypothetical protein
MASIALHAGGVMVCAGLGLFDIGSRGKLHIFGDIHQHRAGAACCGHMKGLMDGFGQFVGFFHQPVHLGAGAGNAHCIPFLKGVRADHERGHLPGQNHNRDRIHQRIDNACHNIGCTGAGRHQHDTGLACGAGIAFGGMDRALFMAHQNVPDIILLENLVIDRKDSATRIAEYHFHALFLQGLNHHLRSGHLTCHLVLHHGVISFSTVAAFGNKKAPVPVRGRMGSC